MGNDTEDQSYKPVEINGRMYLPMDTILSEHTTEATHERRKKMGCIEQRIRDVKTSIFGGAHAICTMLVPVDKLVEFQESNE
jgi:hypothetical protein